MSEERNKLETEIEKQVFKYVNDVKENMYDHTMIYLNRTNSPIDRDVAQKLLEIAMGAIDEGMYSKIDFFKKGINSALDGYTGEQNPLQRGKPGRPPKK